MQFIVLLVVVVASDVSDVKVMSSTVAVIFAENKLLSYYMNSNWLWYPNQTAFLLKWTKQNWFQTESEVFKKKLKPKMK